MPNFDPEQFWFRFRTLAEKDLPVILQTDIKQSTLSTWRTDKTYPRADDAVKIAAALSTTVEFLVTGSDKANLPCTPAAAEIALTADKLSDEGKKIALAVLRGLISQYPKTEYIS
jgi:transcriptional regulator with XRE-family HTH domain